MKADAQSSAEKEALEWATKFFRDYAEAVHPDGSMKQLENLLVSTGAAKLDESGLKERIDKLTKFAMLDGDEWAKRALCKFAAKQIEDGKPLDDLLKVFIVHFLRYPDADDQRKRKRGPSEVRLVARNAVIVTAIKEIAANWKFPPTRHSRSRASGPPSACSITLMGIKKGAGFHSIDEDSINNIWNERSKS